jgi:hypothetical protein
LTQQGFKDIVFTSEERENIQQNLFIGLPFNDAVRNVLTQQHQLNMDPEKEAQEQ